MRSERPGRPIRGRNRDLRQKLALNPTKGVRGSRSDDVGPRTGRVTQGRFLAIRGGEKHPPLICLPLVRNLTPVAPNSGASSHSPACPPLVGRWACRFAWVFGVERQNGYLRDAGRPRNPIRTTQTPQGQNPREATRPAPNKGGTGRPLAGSPAARSGLLLGTWAVVRGPGWAGCGPVDLKGH